MDVGPAEKATKTIAQFCADRFLPYHAVAPNTRQQYDYVVRNHIVPYIGHWRISEASREIFYNLLVKVLPAEEASEVTVRATRKVLSAMCQMALDEGYRKDNPLRTVRLPQVATKPILVASHDQWRRLEEALTYPPARLYARLNVTTWARTCEMIGFRPRDFDFGERMVNITRSTVYLTAKYNPSGKAGWLTKPHPKNGDWRRFTVSKQMCEAVQQHIEEYSLGPDDLLFPLWMFAFVRPQSIRAIQAQEDEEALPPLVSKTGVTHEHGTLGARYTLNCHCPKCKVFATLYQRRWRRKQTATRAEAGELRKAHAWRRDGTECMEAKIWGRFWREAREELPCLKGSPRTTPGTPGSAGRSTRGSTCRRSASAQGTAVLRSPPGMPPSSTSGTAAWRTPSRRSSPRLRRQASRRAAQRGMALWPALARSSR